MCALGAPRKGLVRRARLENATPFCHGEFELAARAALSRKQLIGSIHSTMIIHASCTLIDALPRMLMVEIESSIRRFQGMGVANSK